VTVLETIQKSADFFAKKSVDSPRLQAELLLAHALKMPRMKLYLNFNRELTPTETDLMRDLVKRRGQREPLQHITGSTSFCGLEIAVNKNVLVPRPETELLAEMGWEFLKGISGKPPAALDFGTGSGCIAIALAANCPAARILAVDASAEALAVARANVQVNGYSERISFLNINRIEAMLESPRESFDLVVSNPPYIPADEIATLQPEVRDYDPRMALDGGPEGLDYYRLLAKHAGALLLPSGKMMLEFGDGQAEQIGRIFSDEKWIVECIREDYNAHPRIIVVRRL
jgi:release factor glutamine methyltransferase